MAINANTTQRRLVAEVNEWADSHKMIDRFGYGDFLELYSNSKNSYPYFTLNIKDATSSQWYYNFTLEICVIGWLYDNKEGQLDSESELIEILRDFQNTVKESPRWQSFSRIQGDMTMQKLLEKGGDKALAWCGRMTIQIKKTSGFCSLTAIMPEYDFDSGTVITPSCDPASILINATSFDTVASGGSLDIPVKDTDGLEVGSKIGTEWIVPKAGGGDATQIIEDTDGNELYSNNIPSGDTETQVITDSTVTNSDSSYNSNILAQGSLILPDVTNTDSDGSPVITPAQTPFVCTPSVPAINASQLSKTGANPFTTNDDGNLQFGQGVDFFTLDYNNKFGNTSRFTDDLGTQLYVSGVIVDWTEFNQINNTVLCYYQTVEPAGKLTDLLNAQPYTKNSFSSWWVSNMAQLLHLFNYGVYRNVLNYAPFNLDTSTTALSLWSSTRDSATVAYYVSSLGTSLAGHTGSRRALLSRTYTLTELGL